MIEVQQRIIGFGGPIGAGKNTAATIASNILAAHQQRVIEVAFADEVKRIASECFGWDGVKDAAGRRLLQVIGTEAGRAYNPTIWVETLIARLYTVVSNRAIVLITDCRFPNEVDFVNRHGVSVLLTDRTTTNEGIVDHASETSLGTCDWRVIMSNGGTLEDLQEAIKLFLVTWKFIPGETYDPD
jgi:hypothetical protein